MEGFHQPGRVWVRAGDGIEGAPMDDHSSAGMGVGFRMGINYISIILPRIRVQRAVSKITDDDRASQ